MNPEESDGSNLYYEIEAELITAATDLHLRGLIDIRVVEGEERFDLTDAGFNKAKDIFYDLPCETQLLLRVYIGHLEMTRISAYLEENEDKDEDDEND